nr:unnamed protein product [Haemonchus contortus]
MFNLYLRTYQFGNPFLGAYRENFDLFNYYTLMLPVLSTIYFVKVKRRRVIDIANKINLLRHMAAPTSLQQNLSDSYCIERGVLTATTTYYRVSLLITLLVSIMSAISMVNFIIRYHRGSLPFHSNLKEARTGTTRHSDCGQYLYNQLHVLR